MKKILLLSLFFAVVTPALCQQVSQNDSIETKNINILLDLMGSTRLVQQTMEQMMVSIKKALPDVPEEFWSRFMQEVDYHELISLIIPVYEKYFTNEDILQLISFYQSPVGQKYIQSLPSIMQESMEIGQNWGQELGTRVVKELGDQKK